VEETKGRWEVIRSPSAAKIFNIKQLTGQLKGRVRCRVDDWRVIYEVDAATRMVAMITILSKGEAYK